MLKKFIYGVIVVLIIIFATLFLLKEFLYPCRYEEYVEQACSMYKVDPYLVYAVIKQESNFNSTAQSSKNAKGLMQLMDSTAEEQLLEIPGLDKEEYDILDEQTNIWIGVKYLAELIKRYDGNIYIALSAYNAGIGNVNSWFDKDYKIYNTYEKVIEKIEFGETKQYVTNIIKYYDMYRKLYL